MKLHLKPPRTVIVALAAAFAVTAQAQNTQSGLVSAIPGGSAANFYYAKPGDITILVEVWGYVQRPGRYEVSTSINLINLISLAGGPSENGRVSNIRITRIVKGAAADARQVLTVDLEDLTRVKESELALQPGDVVYVDSVLWASWARSLAYVLPVLSLALSVLQLYLIVTH